MLCAVRAYCRYRASGLALPLTVTYPLFLGLDWLVCRTTLFGLCAATECVGFGSPEKEMGTGSCSTGSFGWHVLCVSLCAAPHLALKYRLFLLGLSAGLCCALAGAPHHTLRA